MADWKLTVRHGSTVTRAEFDRLADAMTELVTKAAEVRDEGPLKGRSMVRDFAPADQVAARLEISGRGLFRAPTAGVDVKGDGSVVAFAGALRREPLEAPRGGSVFDAVHDALRNR